MQFNRKKPCGNCPFKRGRRGYLTAARAEEIAEAVLYGNAVFPCHKTTILDEDQERIPHDGEEFCAGAISFTMGIAPYDNNAIRLAANLGLINPADYEGNEDIFACEEEMIEFHHEGSGR